MRLRLTAKGPNRASIVGRVGRPGCAGGQNQSRGGAKELWQPRGGPGELLRHSQDVVRAGRRDPQFRALPNGLDSRRRAFVTRLSGGGSPLAADGSRRGVPPGDHSRPLVVDDRAQSARTTRGSGFLSATTSAVPPGSAFQLIQDWQQVLCEALGILGERDVSDALHRLEPNAADFGRGGLG
jgi:hypothetical protein